MYYTLGYKTNLNKFKIIEIIISSIIKYDKSQHTSENLQEMDKYLK